MRLSTLVRWLILLAVLGWAGYTVAGAGWSYFTTLNIVDKALRQSADQHKAAFATGNQMAVNSLETRVRNSILLDARHDGVPLQEGDVSVSANSMRMLATVRWSYPVIWYQDNTILVIPLSVERSFVPAP